MKRIKSIPCFWVLMLLFCGNVSGQDSSISSQPVTPIMKEGMIFTQNGKVFSFNALRNEFDKNSSGFTYYEKAQKNLSRSNKLKPAIYVSFAALVYSIIEKKPTVSLFAFGINMTVVSIQLSNLNLFKKNITKALEIRNSQYQSKTFR